MSCDDEGTSFPSKKNRNDNNRIINEGITVSGIAATAAANDDNNDDDDDDDDLLLLFPTTVVGDAFRESFEITTTDNTSDDEKKKKEEEEKGIILPPPTTTVSTPWLDDNETLQRSIEENNWLRWDGVEGTAEDHVSWMYEFVKSITSEKRHEDEFREYGEKDGVKCYIHDELTVNGYGFFKLVAPNVKLQPRDLAASMYDFQQTAESDSTVVMMKFLNTKPIHEQNKKNKSDDGRRPSFVVPAYWCNAPGFPFYYRDGVDLSGIVMENDGTGTMWQLATSAHGNDFVSMTGRAIAATDRYWGYKLVPNKDNETTHVTLICQQEWIGWIPKSISNYMLGSALIDYISITEENIRKNKQSGRHQKLLKFLQLE